MRIWVTFSLVSLIFPFQMNSYESGTVISLHARMCVVVSDLDGREVSCKLRGKLFTNLGGETKPVTVGDHVRFNNTPRGEALEEVFPRKNSLTRPAVRKKDDSHTIAANIDRVIIVASIKTPPLRFGLIDRFLVAAGFEEFGAVLCLNKIDLIDSKEDETLLEQACGLYRSLGYQVLVTSAKDGQGIDSLKEAIRDGISLIVGHSGVGKSTLINKVDPELNLKTGVIREKAAKGRHITTKVSLLRPAGGGFVIDTPGVREFGMSKMRLGDLGHFFPEIAAALPSCRFPDCTHRHEPKCAVLEAAEEGKIAGSRYASYLKIIEELEDL